MGRLSCSPLFVVLVEVLGMESGFVGLRLFDPAPGDVGVEGAEGVLPGLVGVPFCANAIPAPMVKPAVRNSDN
jgi:hypothetical protein